MEMEPAHGCKPRHLRQAGTKSCMHAACTAWGAAGTSIVVSVSEHNPSCRGWLLSVRRVRPLSVVLRHLRVEPLKQAIEGRYGLESHAAKMPDAMLCERERWWHHQHRVMHDCAVRLQRCGIHSNASTGRQLSNSPVQPVKPQRLFCCADTASHLLSCATRSHPLQH